MIDLDAPAIKVGLPEEVGTVLGYRAVVALQRRHLPGVRLAAALRDGLIEEELRWQERAAEVATYEDINRVTEEGAPPSRPAVRRRLAWYASSNRARSCGVTMDLDNLNKSVTHAILQAEAFPRGSWEAQHAFREVADLEEEIATIAGAGVVEGDIARLGAVTAAMSAGEPLRAIQLGGRYLADELSDSARAKLEELVDEANAEIEREAVDGPSVAAIRFSLRAA